MCMHKEERVDLVSEQQAIEICFEEFMKSVNWFCDGIQAGHPDKTIVKQKYAQYMLLEFARRIDKRIDNGILEEH